MSCREIGQRLAAVVVVAAAMLPAAAAQARPELLRGAVLQPGSLAGASCSSPNECVAAGSSGTVTRVGASATAPGTVNGGMIAFTSIRGGGAAVWTMAADGANETRLTHVSADTWDGEPAYSPDGRRIAYVCGNLEICVMNANGSDPAAVTFNSWQSRWVVDSAPSWSPDGTQLVFDRFQRGRDDIYVVNVDGTGLHPLTFGVFDENAVWSPDGARIAFDGYDRGTRSQQIFVISPEGGGRHQLTRTRSSSNYEPAWSPDGQMLVYSRTADSFDPPGQLHVMHADGTGDRAITVGGDDDQNPRWSPDGTQIAFDRDDGVSSGIWLAGPTGAGARDITRTTGLNTFPSWQPMPAQAPSSPLPPSSGRAPSAPTTAARLGGITLQQQWLFYDDFSTGTSLLGALTLGVRLQADGRMLRNETLPIKPTTKRGRALKSQMLIVDKIVIEAGNVYDKLLQAAASHDQQAARRDQRDWVRLLVRYENATSAISNAE